MPSWFAPSRPRVRPADLTYAADERPPPLALATLGLQHAVMALALTTYVLIAARQGGLDAAGTRSLLAMTVLAMAIATLLQAFGGRFGAGALIVHMPDPFYIGVVAATLKAFGPGGLLVFGLTSGVVQIAFARVLPRMRAIFPGTVVGVVVLVAGLSLVEFAFEGGLGLDRTGGVTAADVVVFVATLGTIAAFSIWGSPTAKIFGLIAGLAVGIALAAVLGVLDDVGEIATAPMAALPHWTPPAFAANPTTILAVAFIATLVSLDTLACVVIVDRMDDAAWRRADLRMVAGGVTANGIGDVSAGLLGGMPVAPSSANLGLVHASRATSRRIGVVAAVLFAAVALSPKVLVAITLIPTPVMGAIALYAAAFLITSGIELIASRALDTRTVFMVGIAVSLGMVSLGYEHLVETAPALVKSLFEDALVVAGGAAILLNLLFRLGTRRTKRVAIDGAAAAAVADLVDGRARAWNARTEVVRRAVGAAIVACEAIEADGRRIVAAEAAFDEFNLDIAIEHTGAPIALAAAAAAPPEGSADLLDGDDGPIEAAVAGARAALLARLPDRIAAEPNAAGGRLLLHFDH